MEAKTVENRVSDLEEMVGDIPRLINLRFSHTRAQLDALDARVSTVEVKIDQMRTEVQAVKSDVQTLKSEVQALPRVIAEMLDQHLKHR